MIQVLNRALDILEMLSRNLDKEHSLSEIADSLKLNHGTCANIIKTMAVRGYIEKRKGYLLGRQAYYLTNNFSNETEIVSYAVEPMKILSKKLHESCILAIIKHSSRISIHKETIVQELQVNTLDEKHVYLTATGRLLLAYLDPIDRNAFIKTYGLPGEMWKGVDNEQTLIDELMKINKEECAIHHAESNVVGIAMPVFSKTQVVASLAIYLPESRFNTNTRENITNSLKETATIISKKLTF